MQNSEKTEKYIKEYMKKHYRRRPLKAGSVAATILSVISQEAKSLSEIMKELDNISGPPFIGLATWYPEMRRRSYSASQLTGGVSNLERGGYIKKGGKQTVFLTERGMREILKFKMKDRAVEKRWDGKWRIVVFDIEETTRKDRDYLRRQLKWIGFEELQKSVWIFPYEIRDELREFIRMCKFEFRGDVRFILADTIESDILLRKKFNLD